MESRRHRYTAIGLSLFFAHALNSGCASATRNRAWLETTTANRTGHPLGPRVLDSALPPNLEVTDGLSADEAVAIALWRSPTLQAELTSLDTVLADLDEAGRLPNPRLSFLAPIDPRQLAIILAWPIEAIWQVPLRTEAAHREVERVAIALVQIVLNLERDVRIAHADLQLAHTRVTVLTQVDAAWRDTLALALSRVAAGDLAQAEAAPVQAEAAIAADAVARGRYEIQIAEARLLALLADPWPALPELVERPTLTFVPPSQSELLSRALDERPDLLSAELAVQAAAARANWERSRVFGLMMTLDGQAPIGGLGPHFAPGVQQVELPIFSQNQGGIGRAEAAIARASYQYRAMRLTVTMEVRTAYAALERAIGSLAAYDSIRSSLREATIGAQHAYEDGAESYLFLIDALRRQANAEQRYFELEAEFARAEAELCRAVGGSITMEER